MNKRLTTQKTTLLAVAGLLVGCGNNPSTHTPGESPAREPLVEHVGSTTTANGNDMNNPNEIVGRAPHHGETKGKLLMIAANPSVSEQTGWPIGLWASELTHPYHAFVEAGYQVTLASPQGGRVEFDGFSDPTHESGYSAQDLLTRGFMANPDLMGLTESTQKLSTIDPAEFQAIFLVGGQSPMYTFRGNEELMRFVADFYETGKPTAAVCHSTSILLDTKLSSGRLLVADKTWTGFADSEEAYVDQAVGQRVQPFWIETEARKIADTNFVVQDAFTEYAIRDGNLITGQQQNSGAAAALLVMRAIEEGK